MPRQTSRARVPAIILALIAAEYAWALFLSTFRHPGSIGWNFNTPGTDYMVLYTAVIEALHGRLGVLYDPNRFTALLNARFHNVLSGPLMFTPWVYPPPLLVLLLPFAALPFRLSYAAFQVVTAAALFASIGGLPRRAGGSFALAAVTLLSPAAAINAVYGQTAFLTASLLIGGTRLLISRPLFGGALLGLLCVKPQHALLVPVILLATRNWRAALAALASAICLSLIVTAIFGIAIWTGWLASAAENLSGGYAQWFLRGQIWDNSVQTCLYLLGLTLHAASLLAACVTFGTAIMVYAVFRSDRPADVKLAFLLIAATLAAPHIGPYDLILLVAGTGLFLTRGAAGWMWGLAVCAWILPVLDQPVVSPPARLGPFVAAALVLALLRSRRPEGEAASAGA